MNFKCLNRSFYLQHLKIRYCPITKYFMKHVILLLYFVFMLSMVLAVLPAGVSKTPTLQPYRYSFAYKDSRNYTWVGYSPDLYGNRLSKGYGYYDDSFKYHSMAGSGVFTDALEFERKLYVSSFDGLYTFNDLQSELVYQSIKLTSLNVFKDTLFAGSMGNGLLVYKNGKGIERHIAIDGVNYDTILSVSSHNNVLWIGSSKGLIKFENGKYKVYNLSENLKKGGQYYNYIRTVAIDGNGRLWCANGLNSDSLPNLFRFENDSLCALLDIYHNECVKTDFLPKGINRLYTARNGSILAGMNYGLIEFSDDMKYFVLNDTYKSKIINADVDGFNFNSYDAIAIEDVNGHYMGFNSSGIWNVDRLKYNLSSVKDSFYQRLIFTSSEMNYNDIHCGIANDGILYNNEDLLYRMLNGKSFSSSDLNCRQLLYNGSLWVSGFSESKNKEKVAAVAYRNEGSDFVPGPVNFIKMQFDSVLSSQYNKIWVIEKRQIDEFIENRLLPNYKIPQEIAEWPANPLINTISALAPFVDVNADGVYNPAEGDYPKMKGDKMLWWVFNDVTQHSLTKGEAMGLQINASCYAFRNLKINNSDSDYLINRSIFFNFEIVNVGPDNFSDVQVGLYLDPDIGYYGDDAVTCDTINNLIYLFNRDSLDEGMNGLGSNPPMVLTKFLNNKMHFFSSWSNSAQHNPIKLQDFYRKMRNLYLTNDSVLKTHPNFGNTAPCQYQPALSLGTDTRSLMVSTTGQFLSGKTIKFDFVNTLFYDPDVNYLNTMCNQPLNGMKRIQSWYDNDVFPSFSNWSTDIQKIEKNVFLIYPNPAGNVINVEADSEILLLKLQDALGRTLDLKHPKVMSVVLDLSQLVPGVYFIELTTEKGSSSKKLIVE